MNCQEKHNGLEQAMEVLNAKGFDGMGSAIQIMFNLWITLDGRIVVELFFERFPKRLETRGKTGAGCRT